MAAVDPRLLGLTPEEAATLSEEKWETKHAQSFSSTQVAPKPTEDSEGGDFMGIQSFSKAVWTVFELPSHLLGCGGPQDGASQKSKSEFYDASSIDWAEIFCPSNGENKVSKFDANVVFAFLKMPTNASEGAGVGRGTRHIQCFSNGRINTVDFENNTVTAKELHASIAGLTELVCLRLHNENVTGSIPLSLFAERLVHLEVLDLSQNSLEGELDAAAPLSSLTKLEVLNLSHNKLCGSLPESLGDLKALESLILNNNNFSGSLPSSLSKLAKLSYVDIKFNKFLPGLSSADAKQAVQGLLPKGAELFI